MSRLGGWLRGLAVLGLVAWIGLGGAVPASAESVHCPAGWDDYNWDADYGTCMKVLTAAEANRVMHAFLAPGATSVDDLGMTWYAWDADHVGNVSATVQPAYTGDGGPGAAYAHCSVSTDGETFTEPDCATLDLNDFPDPVAAGGSAWTFSMRDYGQDWGDGGAQFYPNPAALARLDQYASGAVIGAWADPAGGGSTGGTTGSTTGGGSGGTSADAITLVGNATSSLNDTLLAIGHLCLVAFALVLPLVAGWVFARRLFRP